MAPRCGRIYGICPPLQAKENKNTLLVVKRPSGVGCELRSVDDKTFQIIAPLGNGSVCSTAYHMTVLSAV